jgi:hypothetical protein
MSIGNLKDYGNKGNNFPFQLKVLEGIQGIIDAFYIRVYLMMQQELHF